MMSTGGTFSPRRRRPSFTAPRQSRDSPAHAPFQNPGNLFREWIFPCAGDYAASLVRQFQIVVYCVVHTWRHNDDPYPAAVVKKSRMRWGPYPGGSTSGDMPTHFYFVLLMC